jgi:SAM-dependent methyltransferase
MRLRLRVCRGRTLTDRRRRGGSPCPPVPFPVPTPPPPGEPADSDRRGSGVVRCPPEPALPEPTLLHQQADWLAPARSQLWRRVHIARRQRVLDLGTGYGAVVPELVRRAGGHVVALDKVWEAMRARQGNGGRAADPTAPGQFAGASRVTADALQLPFCSGSFDLIFTQLTLLWVAPAACPACLCRDCCRSLPPAIDEIWRALMPGGVFVALEPDYGGMMEYPPEVQSQALWLTGLQRAGADPYVGRKLPGLLARRGFRVSISLFDTLFEPDPLRFAFLRDLPLTEAEHRQLAQIEQEARERSTESWGQVAHLPFVLVVATKPI